MTEDILLRTDEAGITTLTLNRPKQRNALSRALLGRLEDELAAIATDETVKVVVIAANGPVFSSGHDLKELKALPPKETEALFRQCSDVMLSLIRLPQPVIAKVHGMATAAGCQLVATCDLAIASHDAQFATPGVNIGLFCSTPSVGLSRNVGRKKAMEMLLTGKPLSAKEADAAGLINAAVPADELDETVYGLAQVITQKSSAILATGKKAFYEQIELGMTDSYTYASAIMAQNMLDDDAHEGISAFIEKRPPVWTKRTKR